MATAPLFIGGLGPPELLLLLFVAVILFGASKIPKLARSSGRAIGEFQKGKEEAEQELKSIRNSSESETEEPTTETTADTTTETTTDDDSVDRASS